MKAVISILIWGAIAVLTISVYCAMLGLVILFPFDRKRRLAHAQCFWWSNAIIGMNPFWKFNIRGLENIKKNKAYVAVANHQSLADIIVLYRTKMQFKWMAKESLFNIPFIGWCLRLSKNICLSRGSYSSIKDAYRQAKKWLKEDISVILFPEGTRSKTGKIDQFKNGAFKLAIETGKPILPIAIIGTRNALPKGGWVFTKSVKAQVIVLKPVETSGYKIEDFGILRDSVSRKLQEAQVTTF